MLYRIFICGGILFSLSACGFRSMKYESASVATTPVIGDTSTSEVRHVVPASATGGVRAASNNSTTSPCAPFRAACEDAGFVLKDYTAGNRLISDCMLKLVAGSTATSPLTGKTAFSPDGADGNSCLENIHSGPKTTVGMRMSGPNGEKPQ